MRLSAAVAASILACILPTVSPPSLASAQIILRSGGNTSGLTAPISARTTSYQLATSDYTVLMDTSGGSRTATLPASPSNGEIHNIKKIAAANTLTIDGNGNTIDGTAVISVTTLNQSTTLQFLAGSGWYIL